MDPTPAMIVRGSHPAENTLSVTEISRRLSQIRQGEAHLRAELPVDNPHNAILRLSDVTRYIGVRPNEVFLWFPDMLRVTHRLRDRPPPKKAVPLPPARQQDFSRFFRGWDAGTIVKARVGQDWRLVGRHEPGVEKVASAQSPQAPSRVLTMRIDPATLGLRFK
jgi:hypothetical protein